MTKEEVEELVLQIAKGCDSGLRELHVRLITEAMKLGNMEIHVELIEQDNSISETLV